jgi:hypothetical protein
MTIGGVPSSDTRFSFRPAKNPTELPSAEKNGPEAPSVPGNGVESSRSSTRR